MVLSNTLPDSVFWDNESIMIITASALRRSENLICLVDSGLHNWDLVANPLSIVRIAPILDSV